ncbi:hypothetical protein ACK3BK_15990 [Pseudomonas sp. L7]|uniref:hypothetical protein n=1 Tax=Pseudomonas sp. L7 TaxID=3388343 RepID=UPI0039855034
MVDVINEDQIATSEIWRYDDVLAVRPGERESGVEIWHARKIAELCSPNAPAKANVHRVLLVEVDDPEDPVVQDRLRVACTDAWRNR